MISADPPHLEHAVRAGAAKTQHRTAVPVVKGQALIPILLAIAACTTATLSPSQSSNSSVSGCIPSGDESAINSALNGPGAKALLCPYAVFEILHSIVLSANGQELATIGTPSEKSQAVIRVAGGDLSTAIFSRASDINIHNITVDGARPTLGRIAKGGGLIEIGGEANDIVVDHVRAFDPRGWSTLHVFEGGLKCHGARITNSVIGPAGATDGAWADGISFACRDGFVSHNTVVDASDGGIVIFGSPGTIVEDNVIRTENNQLLGAINLVDFSPFNGDYTGTIVRKNSIIAEHGYIKIGIALGPAVWGSNKGEINRGARIEANTISGDRIGFGIAADGVSNFTVMGNRVLGHASGNLGPNCIKGQSTPGKALIRNAATTDGAFQSEFATGSLLYAICIVP